MTLNRSAYAAQNPQAVVSPVGGAGTSPVSASDSDGNVTGSSPVASTIPVNTSASAIKLGVVYP